jgi:hypothetical protein
MKKRLLIFTIVILIIIALFAGCGAPVSATSTYSDSISVSIVPSPAVSITVIPTTPPDVTPTGTSVSEEADDDTKAVTYDGWTYYLDINDTVVTVYSEDPPLHKKLAADGSGDQQLGIRGFEFDIISSYIYVDSNDPDLNAVGTQTWTTTRMNLDGSDKKKLEYGSMSARFLPTGEQKFYFTTLGDSAIYISDFACENVTTLMVDLPNKSDLDKKLDKNKILQLDITEVADGLINFGAVFSSQNGTMLYSGSYKIAVGGTNVEKIKGTYYYYSSQNDNE